MDSVLQENEFVPFVDNRLYLKKTENIGFGIFSKDKISPGEIVEIAPVVTCSFSSIKDENLFKYVVAWQEQIAVGLGWTMIYNHSDKNNCEFSTNLYDKLIAIMAIKEIKKDDQLTVNYGPYWFSSRGIDKIDI